MGAVAILAGVGVLTATAIAAALSIAGQSQAAAKVNQWIRETLGELVDHQTSMLNPANWGSAEDQLVMQEAERVMGQQSPSMTVGGLDDAKSLSDLITPGLVAQWVNMPWEIDISQRKPEEVRKQLDDIIKAVNDMPKTGGWNPDPNKPHKPTNGLPDGLKGAAIALAGAAENIVMRITNGWGSLRLEGFKNKVAEVVRKLLEAAENLKTMARMPDPSKVDLFRQSVGKFQQVPRMMQNVIEEFELDFAGNRLITMVEGVDVSADKALWEFLQAQSTNVSIMGQNVTAAIRAAIEATKGWGS